VVLIGSRIRSFAPVFGQGHEDTEMQGAGSDRELHSDCSGCPNTNNVVGEGELESTGQKAWDVAGRRFPWGRRKQNGGIRFPLLLY
jgi:hypothetical protein